MECLVRALGRFGPLAEPERAAVVEMGLTAKQVEADQDVAREGQRASHCLLLVEGWACRYKTLEDGRRQITAFHVPGDLCDPACLHLERLDQGTCTLTPARVAQVPHAVLLGWMADHPRLRDAVLRAMLADAAVSREWIVNVGRRTAYQRTAHLLCELVSRLRAAGSAQDPVHELPLTRAELADALGLTPVHVGRMLQDLRAQGLVEFDAGALTVRDWRGLKRAGGFDPGYLYLSGAA